VALALVLLVGAGLLFRSLAELNGTDRGFTADGVVVATVQAWGYYPTMPARAEFVRQAVERIEALPGVEAVGVSSSLPLQWPIGAERVRIAVEGVALASGDDQPSERVSATTPGFFDALGIRVLRGRALDEQDRTGSTPVALVNEAFVRRYLPTADPVGRRVTFGFMGAPTAREIVGVVHDVRHDGLHADPAPGIFIPHAQAPTGAIHIAARTAGDAALLGRAIRADLAELNGAMPLEEIVTMEALLARSLHERRFQLGLLTAFSLTALVLATIGIYGVMNRATTERTHEIGVRLAVGAQPAEVRWMVLRATGWLALLGIVAGSGAALLLTRYMRAMLYGVTPVDPVTYAGAAGVLLIAAVLAGGIPAWRAAAVDPAAALRAE
jgi:putative ABC transport system permease protein